MKNLYLKKTKALLQLFMFTLMLFVFKANAQIDLLQTTDNAITTAISSCSPSSNITYSNDFARLYNLTALGYSSFQVTKVNFAVVGFQLGTASNFPVSVQVYASTGGTADANLTLIGQATVNITVAMVGTIVEVPLTTPATVSAPEMLIVVSAPDGTGTSTGFFAGANSNGQTAPGYSKSNDCGEINFVDISDFDGPNVHLVLFPTGNVTTLGVEDFDSTNKTISLYPNPVKSVLNFSEEVSNVKITDISGKTVKQLSVKETSVNVSELPKGVYILSAITQEGEAFAKKIIKE